MKLVVKDTEVEFPEDTVFIAFRRGRIEMVIPTRVADELISPQLVAATAVLQYIYNPVNMKRLIDEMVARTPSDDEEATIQ